MAWKGFLRRQHTFLFHLACRVRVENKGNASTWGVQGRFIISSRLILHIFADNLHMKYLRKLKSGLQTAKNMAPLVLINVLEESSNRLQNSKNQVYSNAVKRFS